MQQGYVSGLQDAAASYNDDGNPAAPTNQNRDNRRLSLRYNAI